MRLIAEFLFSPPSSGEKELSPKLLMGTRFYMASKFTHIFVADKNYHYFLKQWNKYLQPYADVLAYCLMPNHFHLMVWVLPK